MLEGLPLRFVNNLAGPNVSASRVLTEGEIPEKLRLANKHVQLSCADAKPNQGLSIQLAG